MSRKDKSTRCDMILDAAARALNDQGVSSNIFNLIAAECGINRASMYYYVKTTSDLVFKVYMRTLDIMTASLSDAERTEGDPARVVQVFIQTLFEPGAPVLGSLSETGVLRDQDFEQMATAFEALVARLKSVLERGVSTCVFRSLDVDVAARTIISIVLSMSTVPAWVSSALGPGRGDPASGAKLLCDLLDEGWARDRTAVIEPSPVDLGPISPAKAAPFDRIGLAAARRESILIAASRLINLKGVDSTSLDEVAAAVGATKRTLYQHVGNKKALISACVERSIVILRYAFVASVEGVGSGQGSHEAMVRWQRTVAVTQQRLDLEPIRQPFGLRSIEPDQAQRIIAAIKIQNESRSRLLDTALGAGVLGASASRNLAGLMDLCWYSMAWLGRVQVEKGDTERMRIAREVVDLLRLGLSAIERRPSHDTQM